jgi:hypothetical protein
VKKCEVGEAVAPRLHNALTLFLFLRSARFLRGSTRWSFRASSTTAGSGGRDYGGLRWEDYGDTRNYGDVGIFPHISPSCAPRQRPKLELALKSLLRRWPQNHGRGEAS